MTTFGLREIGIEWQGMEDPLTNPNPAAGEMIIKKGSAEATELSATASFSAAREGIAPQTLLVRLFTVDYLPGRERVYSPPYTLFVLSEQDHANWLSEQLRRWSRSAQEVYERENQLYEDNKALRELTPEQLARKDVRDRIESQAIAEHANARQLTSVSAAGKELIRRAARNDQFNVMTMEGLAEMVKTLDEMAKNRMPSVADLLKKAAHAPSGNPNKQPEESSNGEGTDAEPAPQVGHNRDPNNISGEQGQGEQDSKESQKTPSISDIESSMNQQQDDAESSEEEKEKQQSSGGGKFGLPSTTVLGGGKQQSSPKQEPPDDVAEALDDAISEQEDLLEAFSKVAEELQRILDNLEGSTFVKRFKAASRRQLGVADSLNDSLSEKFGRRPSQLTSDEQQATNDIVEQERAERDNLATIRQDLDAYYNRVQQGKFLAVINEMDSLSVTTRLETLADLVRENMHGQSIAHAEFWGDTFDRWAEQLVGPGCPDGGTAPGAKGDSLSPAIVLDVMKILEKEIGLRDETRAAEQAREAMTIEKYTERAMSLAQSQHEIADMTGETLQAIADLEAEKGASFPQETQLLRHVGRVMVEVESMLSEPNTGAEPIAAETEIIELLLQAQRKKPPKKNSKSGSGSNPNGGGEGDTEESALALLGRGDESNAEAIERVTEQATGLTGTGYPEEYRVGLDRYFGELEQ